MAKMMKNPDWIMFNNADDSDPKDGFLTFQNWRNEALKVMPLATDEQLQAFFDQFKNTDTENENTEDLINFQEFEKAIGKVREK